MQTILWLSDAVHLDVVSQQDLTARIEATTELDLLDPDGSAIIDKIHFELCLQLRLF